MQYLCDTIGKLIRLIINQCSLTSNSTNITAAVAIEEQLLNKLKFNQFIIITHFIVNYVQLIIIVVDDVISFYWSQRHIISRMKPGGL